jgi:hypothetical protein
VRPRTDDCCPALEVSMQGKLVFPVHHWLVADARARDRHVPSSRVES